MNVVAGFLEDNPVGILSKVLVLFLILNIIIIYFFYHFESLFKKNLLKKIDSFERSLKDLVEEFRSFELLLNDQKKTLNEYKYNFLRTEQEIARLADSQNSEKNVTEAIKLAKEGLTVEQIVEKTNLPAEEVEPIVKYHGTNS